MNHEKLKLLTLKLQDLHVKEVQKWLLTKEGIKRKYQKSDGSYSFQRLPKQWYANLSETEIKDLLNRLNAEDWRVQQALDNYEIRSAFIPPNIRMRCIFVGLAVKVRSDSL